MTQPVAYTPATSFTSFEGATPTFPGHQIDAELNAVKATTDQVRTNLALIQRDDGKLINLSVGYDQIDPILTAGGLLPLSAWLTATAYVKYQVVTQNFNLYRCAIAHTSGTFATDLVAGNWTLLTALPTGAQGIQGIQGIQGVTGNTGNTGSTGPAAWTTVAAWLTATAYVTGPPASVVTNGGETYVCLIAHTSGTFATDLAAAKWTKVAAKGTDGSGAPANPAGSFQVDLTGAVGVNTTYLRTDAVLILSQAITPTWTGAHLWNSKVTFAQDIYRTGIISSAQITADQNDYNPANLATSSVLRLNTDALRNITGLVAGTSGREVAIINVGAFNLVLKDSNASSTAANRFLLNVDVTLTPNQAINLWYDTTLSRWVRSAAGGTLNANNNLSELANTTTARTNLGLGSIATFAETTAAQYQANTAGKALSTDKIWSAATLVTLTDGATVTPDFSTGINFTWTIGATGRTAGNPTNTKVGQCGVIYLIQDATGSRTITTWNSSWKFSGGTKPTLSTAANAIDVLSYCVKSSTEIECFFTKGMS